MTASSRNKLRHEQISLLQQSQGKVLEAIQLFKQATSKDERLVNMMADLIIELHCKVELIEEQME